MSTALERATPVYHFREQHSRRIDAGPEQVWQALTTLTLDELIVTRALVTIRHPRSSGSLRAKPLFFNGPLRMLELDKPNYAVGGAVSRPWEPDPTRHEITTLNEFVDFDEPGWVKYLTDYHIERDGKGVRLTTETRGYSTDQRARRRFACYWVGIRIGSGLVRRDMLATIARTAKGAHPDPGTE